MRPTAGHENDVPWIDDTFQRPGFLEERESFKIGFVRLDLVVIEQMRLVTRKEYPPLSANQLRQPRMCSPYVVMKRCDCAFRPNENSRIDQTHKRRHECEPVEEVLWYFVIRQQFLMIHEDLPIVAYIIGIRNPILPFYCIDELRHGNHLALIRLILIFFKSEKRHCHISII